MYFYSSLVSQTRLNVLLKHLATKRFPTLTNHCFKRNFVNMTERVHKSNSYISVNVSEVKPRMRLVHIFKRNYSKDSRPKSRKNSEYFRLLALAKPERWKLAGAVCLLLVSSTVSMAVPFSLGKVLDIIYMHKPPSNDSFEVSNDPLTKFVNIELSQPTSTENIQQNALSHSATEDLNKVCGVLVCIFFIGAVCNYGRVYIMSTAGYRMTQRLRLNVFSSVLKQEQGFFDSRSTGELINRISADTQIVGNALSTNISDGLRSTIMVCAGSGMMFYVSPQLALIGLGIVPPVAGIAVLYGRFVRKISRKVQDSLADATQVAEEKISNVRTVRTFGQENKEISTYDAKITKVLELGYKESKARALFFGMTGLGGNIIIISVLYFGGIMVSTNAITVGSLSSFLLYAAYIGVSIGGLTGFYSELNKAIGAAARLWELSDRQPAIPIKGGLVPMDAPLGHIQFHGIKFSYPSRPDTMVVQDLTLEISPGTTVAVVGPSGSGKSTLAALLLRLYDPDSGDVLLDGYNVKDLDPNWLRKQIGTVSQEPVLFSSTIRDNILYGADNPESVTEDDFLRVATEANVHEFVQKLPDMYETLVGERGVMLSGGQKQRVAIARALIKNPKILLLDEATSALDAQSEYLVREAMERVMKGRTVLTIAHRLSTILNADVIAVLENGSIVEMGTYAELSLLENGHFRELMKHQTFQEIPSTTSLQTINV